MPELSILGTPCTVTLRKLLLMTSNSMNTGVTSGTLVRLGGVTYVAAIDDLRNECMDPEVEDHYMELLGEWKKDEDNIKDQLNEIKMRLDLLTASKEATDLGKICSMMVM